MGDDPLSAVIAILAIVFYVLATPFFVVANWKRAKAATRLRREVAVALNPAGTANPGVS
jgi:hypothetical protein